MVGWAQETTLDIEMAHAMAPDANILLVATPTAETEGVEGFPEIVKAENYVINHHLADVIAEKLRRQRRIVSSRRKRPSTRCVARTSTRRCTA